MSSLHTLYDAFESLEHRADEAPESARKFGAHTPPARRGAVRMLAPAGAATAVVLAAATVAVWQHGSGESSHQPAAQPTASSTVPQSTVPQSTVPQSTAPRSTAPRSNGRFQPPTTSAQLTAQASAILAGIATLEVTSDTSDTPTPGSSGAAIYGTLTAGGMSGGFDLNVFLAAPGSKAICDADTECSVHRQADGTTVAVGSFRDTQVPGGITYQVEAVRSDGAEIVIHLSTEQDPKGQSPVTASHLPMTVGQLTDFVTSDRW